MGLKLSISGIDRPGHGNTWIKAVFKSISFCILFTGLLALGSMLKNFMPVRLERISYGMIGTGVALLTTWGFLRVDHKTFADIGLKWQRLTLLRFLSGLGIGIMLSFIMLLTLIGLTDLEFAPAGAGSIAQFLLMSLALLPLAFMEEVAFRAYPFLTMKSSCGIRATQAAMAVMFALYHFAGGQSVVSSFTGPGVWAFVFGLAMLMSGGISLPAGIHAGANFVLAAVGQHTGIQSVWIIQAGGVLGPERQQHLDVVGNALQLTLFLCTIVIMEIYLRLLPQKVKSTLS